MNAALDEQEQQAFHESAHAVTHNYFKHAVECAEIGRNARCVLPAEWEQKFSEKEITELCGRDALFQYIMAACAGKCAMDRWYDYRHRRMTTGGRPMTTSKPANTR